MDKLSKKIQQLEEALVKSEERFRTMFDQSPIGVALIDSINGRIYELNNRYAEIAGRSLDEMASIDWMSITHPDDLQDDLNNMIALNSGKISSFNMEKRYNKPDGSCVWVNLTVAPTKVEDKNKPIHLAMIEDITANKKNEEKIRNYQIHLEDEIARRTLELKNSLLRFKSYFELPLIGVAITSPEKGWIEVNQKLCDLLGYKQEELFNTTWDQLTHPDDLDADIAIFDRVLLGELEAYSIKKRFIRKDKIVVYTELSVRCVRKSNGKVDYFVALINDISERIEAEKKVQETQERLIHSEKLSSLGKFAGTVAHEFNNPLFGVINLIEHLGDELEKKERKKFKDLAQKECWRMAEMIKSLQSFYRPSDGIFSENNMSHLLEEVLLITGKACKNKGIEIHKNYKTGKYPFQGIEDQIKQVLLNILQNAIDSIKNGGIITLKLVQNSNEILLQIGDTGDGIEQEKQKFIFDPFYTTKGKEGTGLGLSVSYGIIKKHGGDISIESEINIGSTVSVVLPTNRKIK